MVAFVFNCALSTSRYIGNVVTSYIFKCFFALTALDDAIRLAKSEELIIPFGVGIAGHVAETKEIVNIKDAYADLRFNKEIDLKTGYKTNIVLSMPITNYEGDVIGVAQIINKTNGEKAFGINTQNGLG